jgi:X-X-X-Leu-X-X-Gly heptad repeat protein
VGALEGKAAALSATLEEMQREVEGAAAEADKLEAKVVQLDEQLKQLAGGAGEAAMKAR